MKYGTYTENNLLTKEKTMAKKKATKKKTKMTESEKEYKFLKHQEKEAKKAQKIGEKCEAFEKALRTLCKEHGVDMIGQAWLKKDKIMFTPISEIKCELKFTALRARAINTFSL